MNIKPNTGPYNHFKSDCERRKAHLAREIRIVVTVLIVSAATSPVLLSFLAQRPSG